ncbi:MAG: hypothetical protein N2038_13695 [Geminicoccaceae bacterium]|nr:hypothetical protein [Geminicoccaceae bacterium]MCX7631288.1 hypothetical protein [Geminicoccaceae bacterium]MDW8340324.1 hypothetical protein [Geminicoccaceae bacterium]
MQTSEIRYADESGSRLLYEELEFIARVAARADPRELRAFQEYGKGRPIDIVRKIRPMLGSVSRRGFPSILQSDATLGQIVDKARGENGPLAPRAQRVDESNKCTRPFHHGERSRAGEWAQIDPQELRRMVRDASKIVCEVSHRVNGQ